MKRSILTFIGILVGVYVIFNLIDSRSEYVAEKIIWDTNQKLAKAARNPEAIPDNVYAQYAAQYSKVIKQFGRTSLAPRAAILLGDVYLIKKDNTTARKYFQEIFKLYPENKEILAEAAMSIGKSFEFENNWGEAEKYYEKILADYPTTAIGLNVPLYLVNHYRAVKNAEATAVATERAIKMYKNMAAHNATTPLGIKALNNLTNLYIALERWTDAVDTMGSILIKYPMRNTAPIMIKGINQISLMYLSDSTKAVAIYEDFIKKHPKHPLNDPLKKMIDSFNTLKSQNVKIKVEEKKP